MKTIQFLNRFDHFVGNGTTAHYAPGSTGTFEDALANSLVYEGYGVEAQEPEPESKAIKAAPANKAVKAAPANK